MSVIIKSEVAGLARLSNKYGLTIDDWSLFIDFESDRYLKQVNKAITELTGTIVGVTRNTTGSAQTMDRGGSRSVAAANTARKWKVGGRYGLLVEDLRTNYFLNSSTPVSQTITLPPSANPVVVSCQGSGAVTVSGTNIQDSGAYIFENTPKAFYTNELVSHSITVNCIGSLSHVQVEIAGGHASATSPILTGATAVTKSRDVVNLNNTFLADSLGPNGQCTVLIQTIPMPILDDQRQSFENQMSLFSTTTSEILLALNQKAGTQLQRAKATYAKSNVIVSDKLSESTKAQKWGNVTALRFVPSQFTNGCGGAVNEVIPIDAGFIPNVLYLGLGHNSPISRAGLHGIVTKLAIYPRALTDLEVAEVTKSWN
ncbi:hypothetical protein OHW43_05895 [Acinetobacter baumannii]|nr:hypothetical protein [Acinetobacter baumannii]